MMRSCSSALTLLTRAAMRASRGERPCDRCSASRSSSLVVIGFLFLPANRVQGLFQDGLEMSTRTTPRVASFERVKCFVDQAPDQQAQLTITALSLKRDNGPFEEMSHRGEEFVRCRRNA